MVRLRHLFSSMSSPPALDDHVTIHATTAPAPDPQVVALIVELGRALHRYGTQANRLEAALEGVAGAFGAHAGFFSTPTMLMIAFGRDGEHGTRLLRECPGAVDLARLTAVDAIGQAAVDGVLSIEDALQRLRQLEAQPVRRRVPIEILAAGLAAFGVALPLGGTWLDALVAGGLGVLVALVDVLCSRSIRADRLGVFAASLVAGFAVAALSAWLPIIERVVAIAALVWLLPGLTLTTAMTELATQHLASGTARFAMAAVVLVQMGLGLALGAQLAQPLASLIPTPLPPWDPPAAWAAWALVPAVAVSFWLLFRSELRDLPWILLAAGVALGGAHLGALLLGPTLAGFVGALLVGVLAHGYSRGLDRPAANVLVPGITFLVPGSIGLTSLTSFIANDITGGAEAAVMMAVVAISLVAGILVSAMLVRPRGNL